MGQKSKKVTPYIYFRSRRAQRFFEILPARFGSEKSFGSTEMRNWREYHKKVPLSGYKMTPFGGKMGQTG